MVGSIGSKATADLLGFVLSLAKCCPLHPFLHMSNLYDSNMGPNTTPSLIFLPDRVNELNSLDENAMMIPSSNLFCLKVVPQFVGKNIRSLNYL